MESLKKDHYYEHSSNEDIAKYLGYSLIFHNTYLGVEDVVRKYYDKYSVEKAFKQMKGVLDLRPVRVWLKSHIEGHRYNENLLQGISGGSEESIQMGISCCSFSGTMRFFV